MKGYAGGLVVSTIETDAYRPGRIFWRELGGFDDPGVSFTVLVGLLR